MSDLFLDITEKNKDKILKSLQAQNVKFTKNINIISYMNRKNTIGIITKGSIEIILNNYDGNTSLVDTLEKNDVFGSIISSVILDEECDIITTEETNITFLDYEKILNSEIIKNDYYITFIQNLLKIVSEQISIKNERIQILVKKNIREKLLSYFKIQAKQKGSKHITLPMSLTKLAEYISANRSAMMKEIKLLNEDGIIKSKGNKITLKY